MEKKNYVKPSMEVYDLPKRQMILCLSNGELGYIPGSSEDEKHLA